MPCYGADLHLGDAHIVAVDDVISRPGGEDVVRESVTYPLIICVQWNL